MMWQPIETAPKDRRIWTASKCGKVFVTAWDKKRSQFAGYATNGTPPIAWQEFITPEHPNKDASHG